MHQLVTATASDTHFKADEHARCMDAVKAYESPTKIQCKLQLPEAICFESLLKEKQAQDK